MRDSDKSLVFFLSFAFQICVVFFAVFDYYKKITQPACAGDHACLGIVGVMFGRYEVLVYTTGAPNKLLRYIAVRDMLISPSDFRITTRIEIRVSQSLAKLGRGCTAG